ncbi:MAG TPA: TIGR02147 family protein [Bdellovibrio sp.]|nr:TIGR02147 family protein [Bdellovibrio sp.]
MGQYTKPAMLKQSAPALEHNGRDSIDLSLRTIYILVMTTTSSNSKAASLLVQKFQEGQLKNAKWSQRAFAKKLGVSSGALSEIMKGKRALTPQLKKKIAAVLPFSPMEQLDFFGEDLPENLKPVKHDYFRLSSDQFHLISDWWHYAILSLIKTKGFKSDPSWIANRLGLAPKIISEAWDRLLRLGHLNLVKGKISRAYPRIETSDNFFDVSIRKAHIEDTKLIEKSIAEGSTEYRDHTSMTVVINKKNLKKAKELIRLFQDQFSEEIENTPNREIPDEVYRLSISFFPLTKVLENK